MTTRANAQNVEDAYWEVLRSATRDKTHCEILEMSETDWLACYEDTMPEIIQNAPELAHHVSFAKFEEWATNPKQ